MRYASHIRAILFFCIVQGVFFAPAGRGETPMDADAGRALTVHRIDSPVTLDGMSDEAAWEGIEPLPAVMQVPHFGIEPSERTEILLAYDDEYLYVAGRLYDSQPDGIQATTMKRDGSASNSDAFGIVLDTFNDNENALAFITTPTGSRLDMALYNDVQSGGSSSGGTEVSWNTFWDVVTRRNGEGWFAEMRIPFSSLRFQEQDERVLTSVIVYRWIARKDERILFPPIPQNWGDLSYMKPSKGRDIVFAGIQSRKPLYVTPYVLGGFGQVNKLDGSGTHYALDDKLERNVGFDLKYGLTSNVTLDVTANTDFAQVEADNQQVNLTRFSLFFPEKRLFFLERSSVFDFNFYGNNRLFHSRRIGIHNGKRVPIYGGVRAVGRVGKWDLGFLDMQTEEKDDLPSENLGVLRMRRQIINPYTYVGGILTSRVGTDGSYNTAYGFDGVFRVFGDDYLKVNWAKTFEDDGENKPFSLDASKLRVHWERYSFVGWAYGLNHSRTSSDYNPGMGFERYTNSSTYIHFVRYGWRPGPDSRWFSQLVYEDLWLHRRNDDNSLKSCLIRSGWGGTTKSGYSGHVSLTWNKENLRDPLTFSEDAEVPPGEYEFYGFFSIFSTPSGRLLGLSTFLSGGQFYDGRRISLELESSRSFSSHVELVSSYEVNLVRFADRDQEFTSHIARLRLLTMLNAKHSVIAFIQYNSAADQSIANVRYRYNVREGTDLYLVYDEGFNTDRDREHPMLPITIDRTVMMKYSHMLDI